ncbi:MAG: acyltransferase [Daejeonella sp.]|nr:acyltransferase [Daejeonella sp.]
MKPHYPILDGLRGVAAIVVVAFHVCEANATSHLDQTINHGYLAVDFFFLLSGFVVGYAYDDRWNKLTLKSFFTRRLVRLQPMVVLGAVIGAIFFYFQKSEFFPIISDVPVWKMLSIMLLGFLMIPIGPSMDIRGWNETYPLNGPAWSLFFEYIANILYGLGLRKLGKAALTVLVVVAAGAVIYLTVAGPTGDVIGGWSLEPAQLRIGFTRMMFPFFAGLLLCRVAKPTKVNNAFFWCSLLLVTVLAIPRIGGANTLWMNGIYESLAIIFVFPLIVYLGASGNRLGKSSSAVCKFLGDISYPIYITHYPIIYTYTAWVQDHKIPFRDALPVGLLVWISSIVLAYICLKFYDEPVRSWLGKRTSTKFQPKEKEELVES